MVQQSQRSSSVVLIVIGLSLAMFMFSVNQTMLSVALPTIVGSLHGGDHILWISTSYMLASTVFLPMYGKLGDRYGLKKLFLSSLVIFIVSCVYGTFVNSMMALVITRFIQGMGGGGLVVLSQALLAAAVPRRERGKYMGFIGSVFVISTVAGPVVGGLITEYWNWRWTFGVNVPFGIVSLLLCLKFLQEPEPEKQSSRIDVAGMVLIGAVSTFLVLCTAWAGHGGWGQPKVLFCMVGAAACMVACMWLEKHAGDPVLPPYILTNRNFVLATLIGMLLALGTFGVTTYMPAYIQIVEGIDAVTAGFVLLPMTALMFAFSLISGFMVSKTEKYRVLLVTSGAFCVAGFLALSALDIGSGIYVLIAVLCVLGVGFGLGTQLSVLVVQNSFSTKVMGTATASNSLFRDLAGTLGMSVVGAFFASRATARFAETGTGVSFASLTPESMKQLHEPVHGIIAQAYHDALIPVLGTFVPLMVVVVVAAIFVRDDRLRDSGNSDPSEINDPSEIVDTGL